MKVVKLNEKDIVNLVKKILKEEERPRGGTLFGDKTEIVNGVINRLGQYGEEYVRALNELNDSFPDTKYKTVAPVRDVKLPTGVKVQSTTYPTK